MFTVGLTRLQQIGGTHMVTQKILITIRSTPTARNENKFTCTTKRCRLLCNYATAMYTNQLQFGSKFKEGYKMKWKQDRIQPCQNWLLNRVSTVQFCCARTDYASILSLLCINWKIPSSHRSQRAFLQNFRHMKMIGTIDFWDKDSIRHSLWYCHNYCTVTVTNDRYVSQSIHLLRQAESLILMSLSMAAELPDNLQ